MKTTTNRGGARRVFAHLTVALLLMFPLVSPAQPDLSILYHEPLVVLEFETSLQGQTERLTFDAFGRRFEILVEESNPGLTRPDIELLIARLANSPDSWARLTRRADTISGIIHDQDETYVIEPRSSLAGYLVVTTDPGNTSSVIYRLADTLVAPGLLSCDSQSETAAVSAKNEFANLTAELDNSQFPAASDGDRATVGIVADSRIYNRLGDETELIVEELFLTVGGIFQDQVAVEIAPVSIEVSQVRATDPVGSSRVGSEILAELGRWRLEHQTDYALTHMLTDRELINDAEPVPSTIAGISFFGAPGRVGVCDPRTGVSISEWFGTGLTALIIAHEIGHNFGAPHDGELAEVDEEPNPCSVVPEDVYLMSPTLRSTQNNTFSQCSLQQMQKVIAAASCLRPTPQQVAVEVSPDASGSSLHWGTSLLLISIAFTQRRRRINRRPI